MIRKSHITWTLVVMLMMNVTVLQADTAAVKRYFNMPVSEFLELSASEQKTAVSTIVSMTRPAPSSEEVARTASCMKAIGDSPVWKPHTTGVLLTKCSFEMGVAQTTTDARLNLIVECVQRKVPDFSKNEMLSLSLSAVGAALARNPDEPSMIAPRTKKLLEVMQECEAQ